MSAHAALPFWVFALTGCTLLSLDDLADGAAAGAGVSDGGGTGTSNGGASSGGGGTGGQSTNGGGGAGGSEADPDAVYEACILEDDPAIFLRLDAQDGAEPNLGSFLGDGTYDGANVSAPSLLPGTKGLTAKKFQVGAALDFTTAEFLGGYEPVTLELWVRFADDLTVGSPEKAIFSSSPASTSLRIQPRVAMDGEDRLAFMIGSDGLGSRETFAFGDFIDQPDQAFHVVAVYRLTDSTIFDGNGVGSDMALYVNGESVSTTGSGSTMAIADAMQNLVIGGDLGSDGAGAILDEFAVYTHELSAVKVAAHYAAALGGPCE